jgi:hypothetical protein
MTEPAHDDWSRLSDQWRSPSTSTAESSAGALRRRVPRQSRRLLLLVGGEVVLTIVAAILMVQALAHSPDTETRVLCAMLTLFSATIWVFAVRNRRGIWRRSADTTDAFMALERTRLERRLASARFVVRLCGGALVVLLTWMIWRAQRSTTTQLVIMGGAAVYLAGWIVGGRWVERGTQRQIGRTNYR